jgi:release factor glutamine methyltransferase
MAETPNIPQVETGAAASGDGARIWTIRDMLQWCEGYLRRHSDPDPRGSAQWLVEHAVGLSKIELYLDMERALNASELDFLRDTVRRRAKGEPLQYLTGTAPFRFITVEVRPGVLIPRPETEVLVSELLDMLPKRQRRIALDSHTDDEMEELLAACAEKLQAASDAAEPAANRAAETAEGEGANDGAPASEPEAQESLLQVLEIGTGSGCIACSIATERPDIQVTATDISPIAVDLARSNAQRLGVADRVSVIECDLGDGIVPEALGTFDALISNPPYIPTAVYEGLDVEVHDYEPKLALDGGPDGLDFYRRLLPFALRALKAGGAFAVELHEDCLDAAKELTEQAGFVHVGIVQDLNGKPRVIKARKPAVEAVPPYGAAQESKE